MIQTCSDDSLRDEGIAFADLLREIGVADVQYDHLPRAQHCESIFHRAIPTRAARAGYHQVVTYLQEVLHISALAVSEMNSPGKEIQQTN